MYKVLKAFTDLKDGNHVYLAGDAFPRKGVEASDERIAELASADNKRGEPLIKAVKNAKIRAESKDNGKVEQLSEKPKRTRKKQNKKEKKDAD